MHPIRPSSIQPHAVREGNTVTAPITWRGVDTTASIDPATGIVTALFPGTGRVQATVGSLAVLT